jgi:hypothetical protein
MPSLERSEDLGRMGETRLQSGSIANMWVSEERLCGGRFGCIGFLVF